MARVTAKKNRKVGKQLMRSGFEKKVADSLKSKGVDYKYESCKIPYKIPESKHNYIPDFELPNGIFVEAKGKLDRVARKKMLLVVQQNPDKDIRFVFMRDNYIAKGSKTKYSTWADKHGIKYTVNVRGEIPDEWISEKCVTTVDDSGTVSDVSSIPVPRHKAPRKSRAKKRSD